MSSERLREAAQKIRETAEAATPGPWTVTNTGSFADGDSWSLEAVERFRNYRNNVNLGEDRATAEHIALWSPPVALAIADWLDRLAAEGGDFLNLDHPAMRLADAILGSVTAPA